MDYLLITRIVTLIAVVNDVVLCRGDRARFIEEPQDITISKGQLTVLKCSVENAVGQVQWLRDGFGLGVGPTFDGFPRYRIDIDVSRGIYDLILANIQLEDDAIFECQVGATESSAGLQSRKAKVTVRLPPETVSIDGGPRVQVIAGRPFDLTCRAAGGRPAAAISWRRDGEPVVDGASYQTVAQSDGKRTDAIGRLRIHPTRADRQVTYTCRAINEALLESIPSRATLDVLYAPEITVLLTPSDPVREFDRLVVTCSAEANPDVTKWRWFIGDEPMTAEEGSTIVINGVDRSLHGKTVACEATNGVASVKQATVINVLYGPRFVSEPADVTADLGAAEAVLRCDVDSNPPPTFVWTSVDSPYLVVGRQSSLAVGPVDEDSFGSYTCTASTDGYPSVSRDIDLLMNGPSRIVSMSAQPGRLGEDAILECAVFAIPKPLYITWARDGVALILDTLERYSISELEVENGRVSVLSISAVEDADFGAFNCTTDNGYGYTYLQITFYRQAAVPLMYILAGVLGGSVIVIVLCVVIFVCRRRKRSGSETGSDSSECRITKNRKDVDIKIEYSTNGNVRTPQSFIDTWKTDVVSGHYHPVPSNPVYPYDYSWFRQTHQHPGTGYTDDGADRYLYSTAPRRPFPIDDCRANSAYGPELYSTMRGYRDVTSPYHFRQQQQRLASPAEISELATNV